MKRLLRQTWLLAIAAFCLAAFSMEAAGNTVICVSTAAEFDAAMNVWTTSADNTVTIQMMRGAYDLSAQMGTYNQLTAGGSAQLVLQGGYIAGSGNTCVSQKYYATNTVLDGQNSGASLYITGNGNIEIDGVQIQNMTGQVYTPVTVFSYGNGVTLQNVIVNDNQNSLSNIVVDVDSDNDAVIIQDSLFYGNSCPGVATGCSALVINSSNSSSDIINTTIAANEAFGLEVGSGTTLYVINSIIWNNVWNKVSGDILLYNDANDSPSLTISYSDYDTVINDGGTVATGSNTFDTNPLFTNASGNYTLPSDFTLQTFPTLSPLINVGAPAAQVPGLPGGAYPATDLAGNPRVAPVGSAIDLGPYEAQPTYVVENTSDGGMGSLRAAILSANAAGSSAHIVFDFPSCGGLLGNLILPHSPLPDITNNVFIDGYSQTGSKPNTLTNGLAQRETGFNGTVCVSVFGTGTTPAQPYAFRTASGGQLNVQGLFLDGFTQAAIVLNGGQSHQIRGNLIEGNVDGVDVTGTTGYTIIGSFGDPSATNVIVNSTSSGVSIDSTNGGSVVAGNLIGLDNDGSSSAGNQTGVYIFNSPNNQVAYNQINYNTNAGIAISGASATNTLVNYNLIGLTASLAAAGNFGPGVLLNAGATGNTIGVGLGSFSSGSLGVNTFTYSAGNMIGYNSGPGVWVSTSGGDDNSIVGNYFINNTDLAIDLGAIYPAANGSRGSANDLQASPVVVNALTAPSPSVSSDWLQLSLNIPVTLGTGNVQIDVYQASACSTSSSPLYPLGLGGDYLTSVIVPAAPLEVWVRLPHDTLVVGDGYSAIVTTSNGDTSEIGQCAVGSNDLIFRDNFAGNGFGG